MAQTSWPFDSADTTESQYSDIFKRLATNGVYGDDASTVLKVFGDSSGMNVKVPIGYAYVRGFMYYNDAQLTQTIAASTSQPRIDLVVLKLDPTANSIVVAVKQGTPAASPVAPALTQTDTGVYEMPLAQVTVGASVATIAAAAVTDMRSFMSSPFGKWSTAGRPTTNRRGDAGFNTTTGIPEYWDGAAWQSFAPTTFTAAQITDPLNLNVGKINGRKITVSNSGAPSSPAVGDVWIDYS